MSPTRSWSRLAALCVLTLPLACGTGESPPDGGAGLSDDPSQALFVEVPDLMKAAEVPGLQLALVEGGEIEMTAVFGFTEARNGQPVTEHTVFEAASLSKPVFAYAVLRLVDRGEWGLDRPLWETLEYERLAHAPRARQLTTRHVLSHTTGLPNWARGDTRLDFDADPGVRWGYSGEGFVFLQRAVEANTGLTLEELARREVFEPLGMAATHFEWVEAFDTLAAVPHDRLGSPAERRRPERGNAAGSLHTTAADYARFVIAVMRGEGLSPELRQEMLRPQSDLRDAAWDQDEEARAHLFWGLGWGLEDGRRGRSFWHWGDQGTARCFVVAYPESEDALVYFTNSANGLAIGPALLARVFDDDRWALRWLDYDRYDDPGFRASLAVARAFRNGGVEAGVAEFERAVTEVPDRLEEGEVNALGYELLRRGLVDEAIWVFERNTVDHPESSNVWDSLGEALMEAGRLEEAIAMYGRSLELDPGNENARRWIAEMREDLAGQGP